MKQLKVKLGQDAIERFSKASAVQAIEELIWNGYDADAKRIEVTLEWDEAGLGVNGIRVTDDGVGIPYGQLDRTFGTIGDSLKRGMRTTPGGRIPRGRHGRGRFKAFTLSNSVRWVSRVSGGKGIETFSIQGSKLKSQPFTVTTPQPAADATHTGVEVEVRPIDRAFAELTDSAHVVRELAKRLALGLFNHPVDIRFDGHRVNPNELIDQRSELTVTLTDGTGATHQVALTVIEWKGFRAHSVYLCDMDGVAQCEWEKFEVSSARQFSFTAYAKAVIIDRLVSSGEVEAGELSNDLRTLKTAVKDALESHFRTRLSATAGLLVNQWKSEGIYPYPDADPTPIARVTREVFDVCAQTVHDLLPTFQQGSKTNRKLLFRLIKQAVETDGGSLCNILEEVLTLTKDQQDTLAGILKRTRLGAVITAAKTVLDRLKFLEATQHLFFGDHAGDVNEPHQLQQILLQELWLFGDEFTFGRQEATLREALRVHAEHSGQTFDPHTGALKNVNDGKASRLDILLNSTYSCSPPYDFAHLVIELKRSSVTLTAKELTQIESYAITVEDDARFDKQTTRWTWFLVGVECDKFTEGRRSSNDRPHGLIASRPASQVWVKTWAELVSAAKRRYEFFLQQLETEITADDGLTYLRDRHAKHLPDSLRGDGQLSSTD